MGPTSGLPRWRRYADEDQLVTECQGLLEAGRPPAEVAAVLRAGFLELKVVRAIEGQPAGWQRATLAMAALAAARFEIAADRMAEQLEAFLSAVPA